MAEEEQVPPSETTNAEGQPVEEGTIVVTGSRIRRDNYSTPQNVDILTRNDSVLAGTRSPVEALQSATVTSGTSQISGSFLGFLSQGGQGANLVGLRGLGAQRTLVLLNGRRLAPAGASPELVAADLNVLPNSVIQRIEILREGASSVYGSDAIAGVINVITDTRMDGLTLDFYSDIPVHTDAAGRTIRASATAGKTFDRGFITGSFEFRQDTGLTLGDRDEFSCPRELAMVNGVEVGQGSPSDPLLVRCFPYAPRLNTGVASGYALTFGSRGGPFRFVNTGRQILNFDNTLTRILNDAQRPLGDIRMALKQTVFTPIKTYTGFVNGAYEIGMLGDAELYGEALFTRRQSNQEDYGTQTFQGPFRNTDIPNQQYFGNFRGRGTNPAVGQPCLQYFGAVGLQYCSPFAPTALNDLGINYWGPLISLQRTIPSSQQVDFFRTNGGIRGNLGLGDWRYDANAMISRTEGEDRFTAALSTELSNTIQAVIAPAGTPPQFITVAGPGTARPGNYTCAANVSAGAYNGGTCYAVNIFDPNINRSGQLPDEFFDYVYKENLAQTTYKQDTFNIVFDGSLPFSLPGGAPKMAIGAEHRRDFINDVPSFQRQQGLVSGFGTAGITKGSDKVTEAFGELQLPIFRDRPFFNLLELRGSGRYTHYESYGSDFTYALSGQWAPVSNLRFRGNYGTNFRAPNLFEQFISDQIGFFPASVDPCDDFAANYQPGSTVYQNCLTALTPILGADAVNFGTSGGGIEVTTSGGRGVLEAEKAKTWGLGVVLTAPRQWADLTVAIDYFNVVVKGEVDTLGNLLLDFCYESEDFPNAPECEFIGPREVDPASVSNGQLTTLRNPYLNIAQQRAQGIDFDARYATGLFGGRFVTQLQATRMLKQQTEFFKGGGLNDFNGTLGYPGAGAGPKWVGTLDTKFTTPNDITLRWGLEYIGKAETERDPFGLTAAGISCTIGTANCFVAEYDQVAEPYWEHGASVQWLWRDVGQVTMGVSNLFNEKPPTVAAFPGSSVPTRLGNYIGNGPYDYRGRSFFINVTRSFK